MPVSLLVYVTFLLYYLNGQTIHLIHFPYVRKLSITITILLNITILNYALGIKNIS